MAYRDWPAEVNQTILQDGYGSTKGANVVVTQLDAGPVKARRRYTDTPTVYAIQLRLNRVTVLASGMTELQAFEDFYHNTLFDGIANTKFSLPPKSGDPETYIPTECRFLPATGKAGYQIPKLYGDYAYVTFSLEEVL